MRAARMSALAAVAVALGMQGMPWAQAAPQGSASEGRRFSAAIARVSAWCDHMPGAGSGPRQYLAIAVRLTNKGRATLRVDLSEVYLSFREDDRGESVRGVRLEGDGNDAAVTLPGGETKTVSLRGKGVFPEARHDETLHATLVFSAGGEQVTVRGASTVQRTD